MRKRDAFVVIGVAVATMAVALMLWSALPMANATSERVNVTKVATPVLEANGVRLTLTLDRKTYAEGDTPVLTIKAENTQESPVTVEAMVTLMTMQLASPMFRRMPMPTKRWSHPCKIALGPRETKSIELPTAVALKAGTSGWFTLVAGGKTIVAGRFAVPGKLLKAASTARPAQQPR